MGKNKKFWWILGSVFGVGFIVLCAFVGFENALTLSCAGAVVIGMILYPFLRLTGVCKGSDEFAITEGRDTGMISCRNCGHLGAGYGNRCAKCGSMLTERVKTDSNMISCPSCGYLGVGRPGYCPKCSSFLARKID